MAGYGKRLKEAYESFDTSDRYNVEEAIDLVVNNKKTKFDETVEIAINLGVDPRHSDQMVRGVVTLPNGTGKTISVAVFAKENKAEEAKKAGADFVGGEDLAEMIEKGEISFDRCISTPDMMAVVGKLGKILGPKGLMPNPKLGTVTPDVSDAIKAAKGGEIEFRAEKAGIIQAGLGKTSFDKNALVENVKTFVDAIVKAKPSGAKGTYMKAVTICSTMGPSVKLDVASLTN